MQDNPAIVKKFIDEVLNHKKIEMTSDFFWEDMVEQVPFPGQKPGISGLKEVLLGMWAAFPDMHWSVQEQISQDDRVMTRFEWTGTHQDSFLGIAATGRKVMVWGVVIDRLDRGKIRETRLIMDTLGLMGQLQLG
jgi:steroid delta-isomerase-like uncharacterized protein